MTLKPPERFGRLVTMVRQPASITPELTNWALKTQPVSQQLNGRPGLGMTAKRDLAHTRGRQVYADHHDPRELVYGRSRREPPSVSLGQVAQRRLQAMGQEACEDMRPNIASAQVATIDVAEISVSGALLVKHRNVDRTSKRRLLYEASHTCVQ